jgi:rubrerythrin
LETALSAEALAHVRYKIFAEMAEDSGFPNLSKLFDAIADSEYHHAKNHFMALERMDTLKKHLEDSLAAEIFEIETMYREYLDRAREKGFGLSAYSFLDALEAEKTHRELLASAEAAVAGGDDIPSDSFATCSSCGYTFHGGGEYKRCPVWGAPRDKITRL